MFFYSTNIYLIENRNSIFERFSRSSSTEEQQSDLLKAASSTLASSTFYILFFEMELGRKRSTRLINGRSLVRSQSSQLLGSHVPWGRGGLAYLLRWVRFPLGPLFTTTTPMRTGESFTDEGGKNVRFDSHWVHFLQQQHQ